MRTYDPSQPLISLHVPKCAGQSMRRLLENWFGPRLRLHYFQQFNARPLRHEWVPGICIHGHFSRRDGYGVDDYYPQASQFITLLRDPLEMALSNYFFWKRRGRARQIERGTLTPGSPSDYLDITDFFRQRPHAPMLDFLPLSMVDGDWRSFIRNRFVWIGTVERLSSRVGSLSEVFGFPPDPVVPRLNESARTETLAPEIARSFREANRREQEIYDFVRGLEEKAAP